MSMYTCPSTLAAGECNEKTGTLICTEEPVYGNFGFVIKTTHARMFIDHIPPATRALRDHPLGVGSAWLTGADSHLQSGAGPDSGTLFRYGGTGMIDNKAMDEPGFILQPPCTATSTSF